MKTSIIIISLLICNAVYGQLTHKFKRVDSAYGISYTIIYDLPKIKKDTVKVIMLVCDTSNGQYVKDGQIFAPINPEKAFYKRGYSVRELYNQAEDIIPQMPRGDIFQKQYDYWQHIYYLDENKQPLSKSIIVWLSR